MPLINTSVPNLIQGVSKQPDATRFAGQCEEQENALSSVAEGLKKRPNTRHIARLLTTAIDSNSFVHFINRSDDEKYVLIHDGTYLYAYSMITGVEQKIQVGNNCYKASYTAAEVTAHNANDADGNPINTTTYVATGYPVSGTYLDSATARASLKALTIADSTFLLNSEKAVGLGTSTSPSLSGEVLVYIKQSDYEKKYGFDITLNTSTGAAATIVALAAPNGGSGYNTRSRLHFAYLHTTGASAPANPEGSGFAEGDIVDVNLSSSYTDPHTGAALPLTVYTQPTIKVLTVNATGGIETLEVENEGDWSYPYWVSAGWTNAEYFGGLGSGQATLLSTSNTPLAASNTVNITRSWKTINATATSAGEYIGSDYILEQLSDFNIQNTQGVGGSIRFTGVLSTYFTTNDSKSNGNVLILEPVKNADGTNKFSDLTISPIDGLAGNGIGIVYKEVNSITDLPLVAKNGFEVKVSGDAELNQDDYYVRFETTGGELIGQGKWVECVAPDLRLNYDPTTLPMEIISDGNGFTLRTMKFADRKAGDDNSNPLASFIAQKIDNLFFFKNRLGFLCGENIVMSESGLGILDSTGQLEYNFGRTTVTTLLDSDSIDISVASSRVTNLKSAKGFQENLVLFAENGQFVLKGGDVLTPKTVNVTPITNFSFEDQVDPLPLGSYIYFPFTRGAFTGMREFTVNASTDNYDSTEVTEHVPSYIPKDIIDMAGTTAEDIIVLLSGDEKGSLYIYNYFWNNNQKVLSAWSKFTFTGEIRGVEFVESTLYMVMTDDQSNTHLVSVPLEAGLKDIDHTGASSNFLTLLDRRVRVKVASGSRQIQFEKADGTYGLTQADIPYTYYNGGVAGYILPEVLVDSTATTHALTFANIQIGRAHV